jgi:uncharacterized protein (TIGR03437 family)
VKKSLYWWGIVWLSLVTGLSAQDLRVSSKTVIRPAGQGGRLNWSIPRNLIAYDKLGANGYYQMYTMRPDGSEDQCFTCSSTQLPPYNVGSPRWHVSGNWLVFLAQREHIPGIFGNNDNLGRPGVGVSNDVWIADGTLTQFWKVADTSYYGSSSGGGALHPVFSHAGDKLFWTQRLSGNNWVLMLADFQVSGGVPTLANVRQLTPKAPAAPTLVEAHDFTPDDTKLIFSGSMEGQPAPRGADIYVLDINDGSWVNLTNTPDQWDEHAHPIPGTNKIMWMTSTQTYGDGGTAASTLTEYWTMDLDGSNKHKLTWFNDSRSAYWHKDGGGVVADFEFNSDFAHYTLPTQVMVYLINDGSAYGNTGMNLMLDLEVGSSSFSAASYYRPPLAPASFVSTFGLNLGTRQAAGMISENSYPTQLGGTTATVTDAAGTQRPVPLVFVSPQQVNFLVPDGTAPGPADLAITTDSGQVTRETFTVEASAPAIFAANQSGTGPAAAFWQATGDATPSLTFQASGNTFVNRGITLKGDTYLILYGSGIRGGTNVTVTIGGVNATVAYKGPGGGYPGLDQINVKIPPVLAGQDADQTVSVVVDNVAANPVTVHIR